MTDAARGKALLISRLCTADTAFFHPRHQPPQTGAHFLDVVFFAVFHQLIVTFVASLVFLYPTFGELAVLNFLECVSKPYLKEEVLLKFKRRVFLLSTF